MVSEGSEGKEPGVYEKYIKNARNLNYLGHLRKNMVRQNPFQVLVANFLNTEQLKDINVRTKIMGNHYRIKINSKKIDDKERAKAGKGPFDFEDSEGALDAMRTEFDMPFWAWYKLSGQKELSELKNYNNAFIYQLKGCNIFCRFCYVDDINKDGSMENNPSFLTIPEIVDAFVKERQNQNINFFRVSGGEPTIAAEQWLYALDELKKRGLEKEVYVQSDTNLTTGHFIELLEENGEIERGLLKKVGDYKNFGLLCSFKGTDPENYHESTGIPLEECDAFLKENIYTFKKLLDSGIDVYPFFYNPNPDTLEKFLERAAFEIGDDTFIRKSWVFLLKPYGPEKARLRQDAIKEGITEEEKIQEYIHNYCQKLEENFPKAEEKMREIMKKRFNEDYKLIMRPAIEWHNR